MQTLEERWVASYDTRVPRHLDYPTGSLVDEFENACSTYASKAALDFFGRRTSYAQLADQVERVAFALHAMGIGPGSRVALLMPNCPQHVVAFYAVLRTGATVVEHNPLSSEDELEQLFADHQAEVAIVWDAAAEKLVNLSEQVRPRVVVSVNLLKEMPLIKRALLRLPLSKARESRNQLSQPAPSETIEFSQLLASKGTAPETVRPGAQDVALLLYTSGTTGNPKGVPLTHANINATTTQAKAWVTTLVPGQEVFMACLPIFHVFGCSLSMNAGLSVGAMIHLIPKPETGLILDAIKRRSPTTMIAVPPLFDRIVQGAKERGISLAEIRTGVAGAMALRPELITAWEEVAGGYLIEGYGLSECSPIVAGNPVNNTRSAGSIGVPFPDTDVRLADPEELSRDVELGEPGEILVKGPQVFAGYHERPEATAAAFYDGWFRTGDIATADENGFLRIVDRLKEVVITGGFNVYPSEVEHVIRNQEGIEDSAVVGVVNERGDEEVIAAVVTADGLLPDVERLRLLLKEKLTSYKVPRRFHVLKDLPRNEMGKVLRREVRNQLQKVERYRNDRSEETSGKDSPTV